MTEGELKIALAIQKPENKSGNKNMGAETEEILRAGGLNWKMIPRVDFAQTNIQGLYIWYKKNSDLVRTVARGTATLAIVGQDKLEEYDRPNPPVVLKMLEFSSCFLKIGVTLRNEFGEDKNREYLEPKDLINKTIITNYPKGASRWLDRNNVPWVITDDEVTPAGVARIIRVDGGAESEVYWGTGQACVEISDSGISMEVNKVRSIANVLESQAVLVTNPNLGNIRGSEAIVWRTLRAIMAGIWQTQYTLLKFNYPESAETQIMDQTPSRESPTKMPLDATGWKAAETLMPMGRRGEVEANLLVLGAKDLVYPKVERMVPNVDDAEITRMMRVIYGESWQFSQELLGGNS